MDAFFITIENCTTHMICRLFPPINEKNRKAIGNGLSNRYDHIVGVHKNTWEDKTNVEIAAAETGTMTKHVIGNDKADRIFMWTDLIVKENLPFTTVANKSFRAIVYKKMVGGMAYNTFMKYIRRLLILLKENIASKLPDRFGLLFDAWSEAGWHYLTVFANYPNSETGLCQVNLLAIRPMVTVGNQNAANHAATISAVLAEYNKLLKISSFVLLITPMFVLPHVLHWANLFWVVTVTSWTWPCNYI